jgi:hypothetical protein
MWAFLVAGREAWRGVRKYVFTEKNHLSAYGGTPEHAPYDVSVSISATVC